MLGTRVVVHEKLRGFVLDELHEGHPGIVRSKELALSYVWWPTLEADLERRIKSCGSCQEQRNAPIGAPLHPWSWPTSPWQRVHVDFAGPFQNTMLLVVVDAHSKWPEVFEIRPTTAIRCLTELFASFGFPETIVTDNGPQFVSLEFKHFAQYMGAPDVLTAPNHPRSNGLAERFIQTLKNALRKDGTGETLQVLSLSKCVQPHRGGTYTWRRHQDQLLHRPAEDVTPTHGRAGEATTSEFLVFCQDWRHTSSSQGNSGYATGNTSTRRGKTLPHVKSSPTR
ncbi:hypothetical protein MTO96_046976 [Rhipicephalus appendiculatus]